MYFKMDQSHDLVYKHAVVAFKPSMVKMLLKGEVGGHVHVLNSHGIYIVDHGKIMELCL